MFLTAVCVLFLLKLKWSKNKSVYDLVFLTGTTAPPPPPRPLPAMYEHKRFGIFCDTELKKCEIIYVLF